MPEKMLLALPHGIKLCRFTLQDRSFAPHFHEYYLFGCLLSGKRDILCQTGIWEISPECLVILNPGAIHSCESAGSAEWLCLNVPGDVFHKMPGIRGTMPIFGHILYRNRSLYKKFLSLAESCADEDAVIGFIHEILQVFPVAGSSPKQINVKIAELCSFLKTNVAEELTLDQMAQHTGLSKYYLIRAFRDALGITPWRYLDTLRVNFGRQMLESGAPIAQCALAAGFYDQSHFSKSFTRSIGYTPGDYLRQFHRSMGCHS